ncbi:hypothetical protein B2M20_12805 [Nitrobacter vulgaris]|uniref:O-antigen ligase-related domain-containing protein n=1 Tax=Nitrobacter vulgaris TaxID=29421 RepID=A0A1V4HW11_NITVU|nr:hypothetical protein B2M20_12805 [Nitrobacter vulgaris]
MSDSVPSLSDDSANSGSIHEAYLTIACIPAIAITSFNATSVCEILLGALAVAALFLLTRRRVSFAHGPLALGFVWIGFVVASAIYATSAGLPGHHLGSLGKHLPIALGPLLAIPLSAACDRLRLHRDTLVTLFLGGLVIGGLLILARNGPFDITAPKMYQVEKFLDAFNRQGSIGRLNRNYAALTCGLSLLGTVALFCHIISAERPRSCKLVIGLVLLAMIFVALEVALIVLPSRTAFIATTAALLVFLASFARTRISRGYKTGQLAWAAVGLVVVMAAVTMYYLPSVAGRMMTIAASDKSGSAIAGFLLGGSSVSERLELDLLGINLIAQRPWFGWGPDVSQLIGIFAVNPSIKPLTQFHNGYIQDIVSFGILGGLLNLTLIAVILVRAIRTNVVDAGSRRLSAAYFSIGLAMVTYLLIANLTESILFVKPAAVVCTFFIMLVCMTSRNAVLDPRG